MIKCVAFLRGINVGGHKKVPMLDLRRCFAETGFSEVKTLLNSGNVLFATKPAHLEILRRKIETAIRKQFGFDVLVIVRALSEIDETIARDPFKNVAVDKNTRLYVTFLAALPNSAPPRKFPSDLRIVSVAGREVFSVLNLQNARSVDALAFIEQTWGKNSTTRNWNTIRRIAELS